jgi:class 3 adenylate cyclase/Tfp pilus assembly protein PilF
MRNLIIGLLLFSNTLFAQQYRDSVLAVWNDMSRPDSVRMSAAHNLVWRVYLRTAPDSARYYAMQQLELARARGAEKQISSALNSIGVTYHIQGKLKDAIEYYEKSLDVDLGRAKKTPADSDAFVGIASSYTNIATLHQQLGNLPLAIQNLKMSLHLLDSLESTGIDVNFKIADLQNNIGMANFSQGNIAEALTWFQKALVRYEKEKPSASGGSALSNIGNALHRMAKENKSGAARDSLLEEASRHHKKSLKIRKKLDDHRGMANSLNNLATNLQQKGIWAEEEELKMQFYKEAEELYREAAAIAEEVNDQAELANILANLAENLIRQHRDEEAMQIARKALEMGQNNGHAESVMKASEKLYQVYKEMGRPLDALEMYELYSLLEDSIRNEENTRQLLRQRYEHDFAEKEAAMRFEQEKKDALANEQLQRKNLQRNALLGGFALTLLLAIVFFAQRNRISKEKTRSEELLLNILPEETAEELKSKGSAEARLIESATVLFTDFKGFTRMSEILTPQELVRDLHECFSAFDHILEKYGIEKIKTIGDAYMAAGGLPTPTVDHAKKVVQAALEMRDFVEAGKARKIEQGAPFFEIRIGVHTGPVVAGIVGVKKFQYDIWGDTVNTASRMESSGEVGQVNISEATYELVKDDSEFGFTSRGKVKAKGKGELKMYFVHRV